MDWVRRHRDLNRRHAWLDEGIPIDGVVPSKWRDLVLEEDAAGRAKINRINYEICVLQSLRECLRVKEIWVEGADCYRNSDEDVPRDFGVNRAAYYQELGQPMDAARFTADLRRTMTEHLRRLDRNLPRDRDVRLRSRGKNRIVLTPLAPQPEADGLEPLKAELGRRWPMVSLLDMLKEADLRTGFTEAFASSGDRETAGRCGDACCCASTAWAPTPACGGSRPAGGSQLQRASARAPSVSASRRPAGSDRQGGQRDAARPRSVDLGRRHHGLCRPTASSARGTRT